MAFYRRARKWDHQLEKVEINHNEFYENEIMTMQMGVALQWLKLDGFTLTDREKLKAEITQELQKDFVLIPKGGAVCLK